MYKLYAQSKKKGWYLFKNSDDLEELDLLAETIDAKEHCTYMIIEHTDKGDKTVRRQELYLECTVEYSDNVKTSFEVKATTFKPSKMKQKEELRKMTQEYYK